MYMYIVYYDELQKRLTDRHRQTSNLFNIWPKIENFSLKQQL